MTRFAKSLLVVTPKSFIRPVKQSRGQKSVVVTQNFLSSSFNLCWSKATWTILEKVAKSRWRIGVQRPRFFAHLLPMNSFIGEHLVHKSEVAILETLIASARICFRRRVGIKAVLLSDQVGPV